MLCLMSIAVAIIGQTLNSVLPGGQREKRNTASYIIFSCVETFLWEKSPQYLWDKINILLTLHLKMIFFI